MIENSLVTIGSNENAIAMQNAIGKHFQEYGETYKKNKIKTNSTEVEQPETPTEEAKPTEPENAEATAPTEPTEATPEVEAPKESEAPAEDTTTTDSTTEDVEKSDETPTPAEQSGDETKEDQKPADENEAKLADALEKIATLESTISDLKTSQDAFRDEVYETMSTFIKSHNDAVDNLAEVNSALGNMRISKGLPHVRANAPIVKKSPLSDVIRQIKGE